MRYIFDSYAFLTLLGNEGGAGRIAEILMDAEKGNAEVYITIVNYGEVLYILERERGLSAASQTIAVLDQLPIRVIDADRILTFAAAHIKALHTISYADAFVVALAQMKKGVVITGDPEFQKVTDIVNVEWIQSS
ncbi:MAG: hypothetical protein A2161_06330 [Candidatus Schekmanbacteria bacterium RBG_13_48_7]|uniref:Ribonuclease VapC n=1 Tax=Candidatus Schekmanbacteria bacterium RBG_13_48_7 TaxID=1817878 RepID=A0A1F7S9F4_9BACT|nr:MAG: hypothetical protein A2161_06330 [Candidatus Schekmanbacteria bacterium RBG_13_48_7]